MIVLKPAAFRFLFSIRDSYIPPVTCSVLMMDSYTGKKRSKSALLVRMIFMISSFENVTTCPLPGNSPDIGPQGRQLLLDLLIASVDVIDAGEDRRSFRSKAGQDKGG